MACSTGYYDGNSGDVTVSSIAMRVTSWKLSVERSVLDANTVANGGYYNAVSGLRKASGTFEILYDQTVHGVTPAVLQEGACATITLNRGTDGAGSTDSDPFTGSALIHKIDFDHSFNSVYKATVSFQMVQTYSGFSGIA